MASDHRSSKVNYKKKSTKGNLGIPKYLEIKQHTFNYSRLKDSVLLGINLAFISELTYRLNALLSKTKQGFFVFGKKLHWEAYLKMYTEMQRNQKKKKKKTNLKMQDKFGVFILSQLKNLL